MKQAKLKHVLTKISLKIFLSTLFMLFTITIFSQVKGIIKDASNGEPLIGASVLVKGTTVGTVTGLDGDFTLDAKAGDVLQISYTGFANQEVTVPEDLMVNVELAQGVNIDEVLVTGYSTQKKKDLSGAVSVVKSKDLVAVPQEILSMLWKEGLQVSP